IELAHHPSLGVEWGLILLSVGVAVAGIWLATRWYAGAHAFEIPARVAARYPRLYALVANKYYVDEAYNATVVKPLAAVSRFSWKGLDTVAIDGTINAMAFFTEITGDMLRFIQTGNVRNYALMVLAGALGAVAWLLL
ncbi:MAG: NADH-quinone oxidoreductase subunit L, partial [Thermoanaerobaculaceae bacterium]|nr:NADH-quinone oxidoreductase subunit L [Thermoanaerobaculaceae bacterium]